MPEPLRVADKIRGLDALSVGEIVKNHLPSPELLEEFRLPSSLDLAARKEAEQFRMGSMFISVNIGDKDVWVPEGHPLARSSPAVSPRDYALGVFEGMSLYNDRLPLFIARVNRLQRSLDGRLIGDRVDVESFAATTVLTAEINADSVTVDTKGHEIRAYGRPSIGPDNGPMGVSIKKNHRLYRAVEFWGWPEYLDEEKAKTKGLTVVASNAWRRNEKVTGKYNSNYGNAGVIASMARAIGADEAILLGGVREGRESQFREREIVDGVGEEVFYRTGKTFIFPPLDNGRLGGTSMDNFQKFVAKELGYDIQVAVVTLDDIKKGEIEAMYMNGNAVELLPVSSILFYESLPIIDADQKLDIITLPGARGGTIDQIDREISTYYKDQLLGKIPSTNPNFATHINRERGRLLRNELKSAYRGWFLQ